MGPINNIPALVLIMDWHWPGDKPLSEPMMVSLLMHTYASLSLNDFTRGLTIAKQAHTNNTQ